MNVVEYFNQEVKHAKEVISEMEFQNEENLREFLIQTNEMLDEIFFTHLRDSIKYSLVDTMTGKDYNSMLGNGKNIDYMDLYEILNRLYKYHHESQEFEIYFDQFRIKINYEELSDNPSNFQIFSLLMDEIEKAVKTSLIVSDFN